MEKDNSENLVKTFISNSVNSFCDFIHDTAARKHFSDNRIKEKQLELYKQAETYKNLSQQLHERQHRLMDCVFLGGDLLIDMIAQGDVSDEILTAYSLTYPDRAAEVPFEELVKSMDDDQLNGLVSGVKGKLFEMKYVDYLNDGELPDGYHAELAQSATQPGWDIAITGPDGEVADVLQAKATDSVEYVQEALERYPDIDVVTTDEVFSHLAMTDASENIINSGITNESITDAVEQATDVTGIDMDFSPPLLSLAMIAFTSYSKQDCDLYQKTRLCGDRAGKSYACYLLGNGVAVLTQTWPLGLIVSLTSRYWAAKGRKNREVFFRLRRTIDNNKKVIKRLNAVVND